MTSLPPYNDEDRELEKEIRALEESGDTDGDAAGTRVSVPRKPSRNDAAIALPEPNEDEGNSNVSAVALLFGRQ